MVEQCLQLLLVLQTWLDSQCPWLQAWWCPQVALALSIWGSNAEAGDACASLPVSCSSKSWQADLPASHTAPTLNSRLCCSGANWVGLLGGPGRACEGARLCSHLPPVCSAVHGRHASAGGAPSPEVLARPLRGLVCFSSSASALQALPCAAYPQKRAFMHSGPEMSSPHSLHLI